MKKLESRCIRYKENYVYLTKTFEDLREEKYVLERKLEDMTTMFLNTSVENKKLKKTIKTQNEIISGYQNRYVRFFLI